MAICFPTSRLNMLKQETFHSIVDATLFSTAGDSKKERLKNYDHLVGCLGCVGDSKYFITCHFHFMPRDT